MQIRIRTKLLAGFAVVALFTVALGWYAADAMEHLNVGQRILYGDVFGGTHLLARWVDLSWEARNDLLAYLLIDDAGERRHLRIRMAELDNSLDDLRLEMDAADTDRADVQTLARLTDAWRAYTDWRDRSIFASVEPGDRGAALAAYETEGVRLTAAVDDAIGQFLDTKGQVGGSLEAAAEATNESTRGLALWLAIAASGLGLLIGFMLSRSIAGAAEQVAVAARGLARGELDQTIAVRSRDELGQMGQAFREMIAYQKTMAAAADAIARGDLTRDLDPKSPRDLLGTAFRRMRANLSTLVGDLQDAVQRGDEQARLANEREARSRAVMDSVADGIVTFDADGRIESVNPAAERIFGYGAAELSGANVARLMSEALPGAAHGGHPADDQLTRDGLVIGDRQEVAAWHKDGTRLSVELGVSEVLLDRRCLRIGVVRDITGRRRAEQRRAVQFSVSWVLAESGALDTAIPGILRTIGEGFRWDGGAFWIVNQHSGVLRCTATWRAPGVAAEEFAASSVESSFPPGAGLSGRVWESRQPVSVADLLEEHDIPSRDRAAAAGVRGAFAFPVEGSNELLAVVEFFSHEVRPPDLDLFLTVTAIGQQIGQFIERERAKEAVRESEARNRATLEAALDCVISMDHDGKIIGFNPAAERTFGYDRQEVLGQEFAALVIPPSLRAAYRGALTGYRATGEQPALGKRLELSALRADGTEFPVELSVTGLPTEGPPVFTGFLRDITQRKQAEEEIRALNTGLEQRVHERTAQLERVRRQNELILTSAGEGIYGVDRRGRATFVNPVAAALTGHSVPQLLGRSLHNSLRHSAPDGTLYARAACPVCAVLRDGSVRRGSDEVFWRQDGTSFPVEYTSTPIMEQEVIVGAVVTFQDISERRAVEKLKDEFVSTVSHEIRTPLNGVLGMAELLLDTPLDVRQREYAEAMRRSGEGLLGVINDILDSAKIEAGKLELDVGDLDVRAVAEDVVGLLAAQAQDKGLAIACLVHRDVPRGLRGDAARLRQILLNLVGNAVKFTERGEVVLRARLGVQEPGARVTVIRFEIADSGPGIDPDAAERIFEPFSQAGRSTTRKYGGTGLGLTISKRLVELMQGDIGLESTPGEGTTFWFTARFARQHLAAATSALPNLRGRRVLVVDDATTGAVLEEYLSAWGMVVRAIENGPQGVATLRAAVTAGRPFDLVLLDRHLPGLDGLELARQIRADADLGAPRLVLVSCLVDEPWPEEAETSMIAAWLTKPVRQSQLFDTLVDVLSGMAEPRAAAASRIREAAAGAATQPAGPQVLVVEDTPINQQVARGMLAKLGYRADVAANGRVALDALGGRTYAAVLMDCHMPEVDGFEASREIRRREGASRHTPIIAMTAGAMRGEREKCLAAGMDDYLTKPVRLPDLEAALRRWAGAGGGDAGLDRTVILGLREYQVPAEEDVVAHLITLFMRETPRRLADIRTALESGDAPALERAAHALKGSAGTLGAYALRELCAQLEELAESGTVAGAAQVVDAVAASLERARPVLEELRAEASSCPS
jgi:PAS domain S-box-containing protein